MLVKKPKKNQVVWVSCNFIPIQKIYRGPSKNLRHMWLGSIHDETRMDLWAKDTKLWTLQSDVIMETIDWKSERISQLNQEICNLRGDLARVIENEGGYKPAQKKYPKAILDKEVRRLKRKKKK